MRAMSLASAAASPEDSGLGTALWVLAAVGQTCYFARFLIQWVASERAGESVLPRIFWWLSLAGSLTVGAYTAYLGRWVLLAGYVLNTGIYLRNLSLRGRGMRARWAGPVALLAILVLLVVAAETEASQGAQAPWLEIALLGQSLWCSRFVVQWWASERTGQSHFPLAFWWLSLLGNSLLLAYAVHLGYAILIAAYLPGPFVQVRNLVLELRRRRALGAEGSAG